MASGFRKGPIPSIDVSDSLGESGEIGGAVDAGARASALGAGEGDASIAQVEARKTIRALLECLDDRERIAVTGLMLDGQVQYEIADALGISQSPVSRIHGSDLQRMREAHEG